MKAPSLGIASYNLQKCVGLDLRRNPGRSLDVIDATGAEVVILQEADKRMAPRPAALPHDMIRAEGWQIAPFGQGPSLGWHGNALLLRQGISITRCERLELPGLEPRGAILAELETAIGPLRVIGVHLGLVARWRRLQCAALRRAFEPLPRMPTLIAGDFNAWGKARDLDAELGWVDLQVSPASFPSARPVAPLDRIGISRDLSASPVEAVTTRPAQVASDHLPIRCRISRRGE
ncbi:Metal-dependent hydrolase, endonuclease/exonuclease/phosphatase family [Pseudooceanicola antarcticus]|uniref:Endonuclease n=1 Tax=Pseudooceanicola antarcticus TaxID=1247613 RepID=A0A285IW92_9RHOB|nr:endonuclease/exonuclease/phosphatase family protein [Pseudooceanicola antarcticus]PJE25938.1 endonuclease [Pseudooceanicola antarcticus]SNY52309.1 Metal-dependent hydrolase, endonuclease/exonuclease/phosphatase family [Pseudooceanicola antarcticus]